MSSPQDPYVPPPGYGPQPGQPQWSGSGPVPGSSDAPEQSPYAPPPGYAPPAGYGPPPGYQPQWGPPPPGYYGGAPATNTKAMIALGLAIAAYTPIVPFIGAIIALFVAASAKREILASGGRQTGLSLCTWATVLSVIHLVLIGLLVVLFLGLFLVPFGFAL